MSSAQIIAAAINTTNPDQAGIKSVESKPGIVEVISELPSESMGRNFRVMTADEIASQQQSSGVAAPDTTKGGIPSGQSPTQGTGPDQLQTENATLHKLMLKLDPALVDQVQADNNAQLKLIGRLMGGTDALGKESDQSAVNAALKKVISSSVVTQEAVDAAMDNAGLKSAERNLVADLRANGTSSNDVAPSQNIVVSSEMRAIDNVQLKALAKNTINQLPESEREKYLSDDLEKACKSVDKYNLKKPEKIDASKVDSDHAVLVSTVSDLNKNHQTELLRAIDSHPADSREDLKAVLDREGIRRAVHANDKREQELRQDEDRHQQAMGRGEQKQETYDERLRHTKVDNLQKETSGWLKIAGTGAKVVDDIRGVFGLKKKH